MAYGKSLWAWKRSVTRRATGKHVLSILFGIHVEACLPELGSSAFGGL